MNGMAELITIAQYWRAVDRPAADRRGPAQQRPQPGHLGDAGHGGLAEVRGVADPARRRLRRVRPQPGPARHQRRRRRTSVGPALGAGAVAPTGRRCWTSAATPTCRRSRRTPPSSRPSRWPSAVLRGDEDAGASSSRAIKQKVQQYLPGKKDERLTLSRRGDRSGPRSSSLHDVRTGRFERTLAALTAAGAAVTAGEIYISTRRGQLRQQDDVVAHRGGPDRGSGRGRRGLLPAGREDGAAGGLGGRSSPTACRAPTCTRAASRSGPVAGADHVQHGDPGRRCSPRCWPSLVGGMGLLAAVLRREDPGAGERDALMPFRSPDQRAITPQGRGRFPGFDVLDAGRHAGTTSPPGVVLARLAPPKTLSFFTPAEVASPAPLLDLLLDQDGEPRVPVLALIDAAAGDRRDRRLALRRPARGRPGLARHPGATSTRTPRDAPRRRLRRLTQPQQARLLQAVQDLAASGDRGTGWPAKHVWSLWTRYACTAFYSHPWAWNEIGFPGPAYPRGYLNPGIDARERWEVADHHRRRPDPVRRTEWNGPARARRATRARRGEPARERPIARPRSGRATSRRG